MERILSTGPKKWTCWERGKITQTKAADKFIRAIAADPYLARRLMREAGVGNPEAEEVFARIEHDERLRSRAALRAELGRRAGIPGQPDRHPARREGAALGGERGAYQELGRAVGPNHTKFWHNRVPGSLRRILVDDRPDRHGIIDKTVLAVFRAWRERRGGPDLLDRMVPDQSVPVEAANDHGG